MHICLKVGSDAKIEPPSHTESFLSSAGDATILATPAGHLALISLFSLSAKPGNDVVPNA